MDRKVFVALSLLAMAIVATNAHYKYKELDKRIQDKGYDKRERPVEDVPTSVGFSMYVLNMEPSQIPGYYLLDFYFRQNWHDHRLATRSQGHLMVVLRSVPEIWTPDTFFVSELRLPAMEKTNTFVRIQQIGDVLWSERLIKQIPCTKGTAMRKNPNCNTNDCPERQVSVLECDVSVESYSYKAEEMDLKVNGGAGFLYDPSIGFQQDGILYNMNGLDTRVNKVTLSSGNYTRLNIDIKLEGLPVVSMNMATAD